MKKLIALVLVLVVCLFWYTNADDDKHALVPVVAEELISGEAQQASVELPLSLDPPPLLAREEVAETVASEELDLMVTVSAVCVDEAGHPLAGIELVATSLAGEPNAFTDTMGKVGLELSSHQVRMVTSSTTFWLRSDWTQSKRERTRISSTEDTFLGEFMLQPGGSVAGRVIDGDGQPVEGASVHCTTPVLDRYTTDYEVRRVLGGPVQSPPISTGTDGRYRIQGMSPSTYSVSASATGTLRTISEPFAIRIGQVAEQEDLVLQPASDSALIKGKVLEVDGTPRVDEQVESKWPTMDQVLARTRTDELGQFTLLAVPGSTQLVMAGRAGHDPLYADNVMAGTHDLVLQAAERDKVLVQALHAGGEELGEFWAYARPHSRRVAPGESVTSSDGQGIEIEVPQLEFYVVVRALNFKEFTSATFHPSNPPKVINAVLEPIPTLSGQVLIGGAPVPGAEVEWFVSGDSKFAIGRACGLYGLERYRRPLTTTADKDGRFAIALSTSRWLGSGNKYLSLRAKGGGFVHGPEVEIPLVVDQELDEVVLQVARPGVMEGRVVNRTSAPLSELFVSISRGDDDIRTEAVDALGSYRFEGLAPGWWQAASHDERLSSSEARRTTGGVLIEEVPWRFEIHEGATTHFNLERETTTPVQVQAKLSGQFLVNGSAPAGWAWRAVHDGQRIAKGPFDGDGKFSFEGEFSGPVYLSMGMLFASGCGSESLFVVLELSEGENEWSYNMTTASLLVTGLPEPLGDPDAQMRQSDSGSWQATWEDGERGIKWNAWMLCAQPDGLRLSHVPAGVVTLVKHVMRQPVAGSMQTLVLQPGDSGLAQVE